MVERFGIVFMSWMCLNFSDKFLFQGASQHNRSCAEHWLLFSVCMCAGCYELYVYHMLYPFLLKFWAMYTLLFQCFWSIWQNKSVQTGTRPQQAWKTQVSIYCCLFHVLFSLHVKRWCHPFTMALLYQFWCQKGKLNFTLVNLLMRLTWAELPATMFWFLFTMPKGTGLHCYTHDHITVLSEKTEIAYFRSRACVWAPNVPATGCACALFVSVVLVVPQPVGICI